MATLQIALRLLNEGAPSIYSALDAAVEKAAPKDSERAWWGAYRAITRNMPDKPFEERSELIETVAKAIKAQGTVNTYASKGIRA